MEEELLCPITKDWLEDPITLPCCGRSFSRQSIIDSFSYGESSCPMCRHDLSDFDPVNVPKNITIANMVELEQNKINNISTILHDDTTPIWDSQFTILESDNNNTGIIGRLEITCNSKKITSSHKTLLLMAVDKSGSMSGEPIKQVIYSLTKLLQLAKRNKTIIPYIMAYDDSVHKIDDPQLLKASCGTSFLSAFEGITDICKTYADIIHNVIVIFLTDGQNGSSRTQKNIMTEFKHNISQIWNKSLTIHTIGFGNYHDFNFLDNIRKLGTNPKHIMSDMLSNSLPNKL